MTRSVEEIISRFPPQQEQMLPLLHEMQSSLQHIPSDAVPLIAAHFNLSRAEVHGVITYYHDFQQSPVRGRRIRVCMAEACQSVGARSLIKRLESILQCQTNGCSADGQYTVEPVYCLGLCACGPAMMIDGSLHARVSEDGLPGLLSAETSRD